MKKAKTTGDQPFVTSNCNGVLTASTGFSESDVTMTDDSNPVAEMFS